MNWKKAVFYGGAVLVLAACGDATSPTSPALTKVSGVSASSVKKASAASDSTSTPTVPTSVCNGMVIHAGLDGALVEVCLPTMW